MESLIFVTVVVARRLLKLKSDFTFFYFFLKLQQFFLMYIGPSVKIVIFIQFLFYFWPRSISGKNVWLMYKVLNFVQ